MYDSGIFVFGAKTLHKDTERHPIYSLPLEITWKIFSYLDDKSLRTAAYTDRRWARIIAANRQLRKRLNNFELAIKLGSSSLAKFYRRNKRRLRKEKNINKERDINYVALGKTTVHSTEKTVLKTKRGADEIVVYTKRFKLY